MTPEAWIAVASVVVLMLGSGIPIILTIRKDAREQAQQQEEARRQQAEATRQAVLDATTPIIADRDYWRGESGRKDDRINQLEDQLRAAYGPVNPADPKGGGRRD